LRRRRIANRNAPDQPPIQSRDASDQPRALRYLQAAVLALLPAILLGGCNGSSRERWEKMNRSPQQWAEIALEAELPDQRREAIDAIVRGRAGDADWAVKLYDTVARTDTDAMVRVAALRGLRRSSGSRTAPLLAKLLQQHPPPDIRPASAPVRREAAAMLRDLCLAGQMVDAERGAAVAALMFRAEADPDRNVRILSLEALGGCRDLRVLNVLITAVGENDFTVQSVAERSLTRLTGVRHDGDADAWRQWLTSVDDPFTEADIAASARGSRWSRVAAREPAP
jgi:hypothetical protein